MLKYREVKIHFNHPLEIHRTIWRLHYERQTKPKTPDRTALCVPYPALTLSHFSLSQN